MVKTVLTHLYCYDDFRGFSEDVRKRFSDPAKYRISTYVSGPEFVARIAAEKNPGICKVAIIGVHDSSDHFEMTERLTRELKQSNPETGLILLTTPERLEEIKKAIRFNIDAYIPKNSNTALRIHNAVKKLISEYQLKIFRRRRNLAIYSLLAALIFSGILFLIARLRLPEYF